MKVKVYPIILGVIVFFGGAIAYKNGFPAGDLIGGFLGSFCIAYGLRCKL